LPNLEKDLIVPLDLVTHKISKYTSHFRTPFRKPWSLGAGVQAEGSSDRRPSPFVRWHRGALSRGRSTQRAAWRSGRLLSPAPDRPRGSAPLQCQAGGPAPAGAGGRVLSPVRRRWAAPGAGAAAADPRACAWLGSAGARGFVPSVDGRC